MLHRYLKKISKKNFILILGVIISIIIFKSYISLYSDCKPKWSNFKVADVLVNVHIGSNNLVLNISVKEGETFTSAIQTAFLLLFFSCIYSILIQRRV